MAALAYEFARLIGPFHGRVSAAPLAAAASRTRLRRLIREGSRPVKCNLSAIYRHFAAVL